MTAIGLWHQQKGLDFKQFGVPGVFKAGQGPSAVVRPSFDDVAGLKRLAFEVVAGAVTFPMKL
jgi:hypothetical protein